MEPKTHWQQVYTTKDTSEVSWFQEHAERSLKLIEDAQIPKTGQIIDIGGGASTLVDDLLSHGYHNITVLDISSAALDAAKTRLGPKASQVHWLEANILEVKLPAQAYDVWHDRAVFHFLLTPEQRQVYVQNVLRAVKPGGLVIVATFGLEGPNMCSGLPVMQYDPETLHQQFGDPFILLGHEEESHKTPAGKIQQFVYCLCRKT